MLDAEQRAKVNRLEAYIKGQPQVELGNFHHFDHGVYQRGGVVPAGTVCTGAVHLTAGVFVLAKGKMVFYDESGPVVREAPYSCVTKPLTKRVMYAITDCVLIAVLETEETTPEAVEAKHTVPDYAALEHYQRTQIGG